MPVRRPCLFCCNKDGGLPIVPGKRYVIVTGQRGPSEAHMVDCGPCDGNGYVTMRGSFVDNR